MDRRFRDAYCLHHRGNVSEMRTASIIGAMMIILIMEVVRTSETSVNFNVTTRR
jgi:hypothetical protein